MASVFELEKYLKIYLYIYPPPLKMKVIKFHV